MRFIYGLLVVVVFAAAGSCKNKSDGDISEGEIHYSITYNGNTSPVPREIMPKDLIVTFKEDNILFEIISPFGNSGIVNLSNPSEEIFDTYISIFTLKYFYAAEPGEIHPGFDAMQGMEILKTDSTREICGYLCKNARVSFPGDPSKVYDIWYTTGIDVENPNISTPYRDIDGVLMSFVFIIGGSELHFMAENVYSKTIADDRFSRREKFSRISRDDINRFISRMISL
ncbi:MAG: hypothetical protein RBU28_10890 [Bacteroidales bacterium]|nr:hypothetical protein [Bacteroidales bacterium]